MYLGFAIMSVQSYLGIKKPLIGHAFNFSNEVQMTVLELAEKILDLMDSDFELEILNKATNEIRPQY